MEINKGSREDFLQWLEKFEDNDVIGTATKYDDCPLQRYLQLINPTLRVSVGVRIWFDIEYKKLEDWQYIIVKVADRLNGAITKKQLLELI